MPRIQYERQGHMTVGLHILFVLDQNGLSTAQEITQAVLERGCPPTSTQFDLVITNSLMNLKTKSGLISRNGDFWELNELGKTEVAEAKACHPDEGADLDRAEQMLSDLGLQ